jgi:hypothetical protein
MYLVREIYRPSAARRVVLDIASLTSANPRRKLLSAIMTAERAIIEKPLNAAHRAYKAITPGLQAMMKGWRWL